MADHDDNLIPEEDGDEDQPISQQIPILHQQNEFTLNEINIRAICVLNGDGDKNVKGTIRFHQEDEGSPTRIEGEITGLSPGLHGFHVHAYGDLTNGCVSAGPHYNPTNMSHGGPLDEVRHVGDLGNVHAKENGLAKIGFFDNKIALVGPTAIVGRTLDVHALEDDFGRGKGDNAEESKKTGIPKFCFFKKIRIKLLDGIE
uniref:superoxide dismutase n=2 Tax=Meloidogyne TaxID=189290 RepID=A0A6V7VS50_MELEN|nr:unnamed protein product [Meloidogyne enterolobii]